MILEIPGVVHFCKNIGRQHDPIGYNYNNTNSSKCSNGIDYKSSSRQGDTQAVQQRLLFEVITGVEMNKY